MNNLFIYTSDIFEQYKKELMIGGLILAVGAVGFYFYSDWKQQIEQEAQVSFTSALQDLHKISQEGGNWQEFEQTINYANERHARSGLAPYFMALQAQALIEQNKLAEAITSIEAMLKKLSKQSPLYSLFELTLARVKLSNEGTRQEGFALLQQLAENSKNYYQDQALFYLGMFYKQERDYEKARAVWNQLVQTFSGQSMLERSPWAEQAQQQLQKLSL